MRDAATVYYDFERPVFIYLGVFTNLQNTARIRQSADDRQQIAPALDDQRFTIFHLRCAELVLNVCLPDIIAGGCGTVIPCGTFCFRGCIINCFRYLRVGQIQRPVCAICYHLFFEGKRVAYHRTAKRGNGALTIVRGVALFVLKMHSDIIAPNGVKFTLLRVLHSMIVGSFAQELALVSAVPYDIANGTARFIKLTCCGVIGTGAPPGKRLAGGGVNLQVIRGFQLAVFVIRHVRARRVVLINAFRAARAFVGEVGNALFIARDVAIALILFPRTACVDNAAGALHIFVDWLTGQRTLVHIVSGATLFMFVRGFFLFIGNDLNTVAF